LVKVKCKTSPARPTKIGLVWPIFAPDQLFVTGHSYPIHQGYISLVASSVYFCLTQLASWLATCYVLKLFDTVLLLNICWWSLGASVFGTNILSQPWLQQLCSTGLTRLPFAADLPFSKTVSHHISLSSRHKCFVWDVRRMQ